VIGSLPLNAPQLEGRLSPALDAVEARLLEVVSNADETINPPTSHLAEAGGKRLRPVLTLLTAQLGDPVLATGEQVRDAGGAVELTHIATLYHDDVMDDAPMRRGVPSVQSLFGNSVAILAGDVLFARASLVTSKLGPQAVKLHATTFERLCQGQLHETIGPRASVSPRDHYIRVLEDKTGSLIATSARYGVLFSGGSWELADALAQYGECIGVAFQLADDVIDIESDGAVTGKTPGTDLREGVDTMPTLLLRELGEKGALDAEGAAILDLLDNADLSGDEALADVVARLRRHSVLEETREMAQDWVSRAIESIRFLPEGEIREELVRFARLTVDRSA